MTVDPIDSSTEPSVSPRRRSAARRWWWLAPALLLGIFGAVSIHASAQASQFASGVARSLDESLRAQNVGLVKSHVFRRSLAGGTDDLVLLLRLNGDVSLHLRSEVRIGAFGMGGRTVDTTLIADDDMTRDERRIIQTLAAGGARIHTVLKSDGQTVSTVFLPGGEIRDAGPEGNGTVTWQVLSGEIRRTDTVRSLSADLNWKGIEVGGPSGSVFTVAGVSYHGRQSPHLEHLTQGGFTLHIGELTLPTGHLELSGFTVATQAVPQGSSLKLSASLTADRVGIVGSGATHDVRLSMEASHVNGDATDRMVTVARQPDHAEFLQASVNLKSAANRPYVFSQDPQLHQLLEDLTVPIQEFLAGHPVLSVSASEMTPYGKASMRAQVEIPDTSQVDIAGLIAGQFSNASLSSDTPQVIALVHSLSVNGDLVLPAQESMNVLSQSPSVMHLIDAPVHGLTPLYAPVTQEALEEDLNAMLDHHQLTYADSILSTRVVFSGGKLYLNGNPF